jgi:cellobiose dehydrogenase (acceptor)
MGWAQSTAPVDDPTDPASTFEEHQGFGQYGVILTSARQAGYEGWLAAAPTPTAVPTTTSAVSTTAPTATPTSTTVLGTYDYIVVGGGAAGLVGKLIIDPSISTT